MKKDTTGSINMPFGDDIYIIAAVLDPRHTTQWLLPNDEELELRIRRVVVEAAGRGKELRT